MWLRQSSSYLEEACGLNAGCSYLQFIPINSSTAVCSQCHITVSLKLGRERKTQPYRIVFKYL